VEVTAARARRFGRPRATGGTGPTRRHRVAAVLRYLSLVGAAVVALMPLPVLLVASVDTNDEGHQRRVLRRPGTWWNMGQPRHRVRPEPDAACLRQPPIAVAVSLAGTVLIGSMAAYALDRHEFRPRGAIIAPFLPATLVAGVATQVATTQVVEQLDNC